MARYINGIDFYKIQGGMYYLKIYDNDSVKNVFIKEFPFCDFDEIVNAEEDKE